MYTSSRNLNKSPVELGKDLEVEHQDIYSNESTGRTGTLHTYQEDSLLSHLMCYWADLHVHVLYINSALTKVFTLSKTKLQDLVSTFIVTSMSSCVAVAG